MSATIPGCRTRRRRLAIPLDSPVHGGVGDDERGRNVENLVAEATESVEDGGVEGTGEGALAVSREGVGRNALGGRAACINEGMSIQFAFNCLFCSSPASLSPWRPENRSRGSGASHSEFQGR